MLGPGGRCYRLEVAGGEAALLQEMGEQARGTRARLAHHHPKTADVGKLLHPHGHRRCQQQATTALGPCHQDRRQMGCPGGHQRNIEATACGIEQMEGGHRRPAGEEQLEAGLAAVEPAGKTTAGFPKRPFQERIMGAGQHIWRRGGGSGLCRRRDPGKYGGAGEQQPACDPHRRQLAAPGKLIDPPFLETQKSCDLAGGEVLGFAHGPPSSRCMSA